MLKELHLFAKNCFELCTLYGISEVLGEKGEKSRPSQVCGSCIIWRKASSHLFHSGCKAWKWTGLVIHKRMSHVGIDEDFHIAVFQQPSDQLPTSSPLRHHWSPPWRPVRRNDLGPVSSATRHRRAESSPQPMTGNDGNCMVKTIIYIYIP